MPFILRYAALGTGVVGTILAILTLLLLPLNWQLVSEMGWQPPMLLTIAIGAGGIQWFIFQQRRYRTAVGMFATTLAAW